MGSGVDSIALDMDVCQQMVHANSFRCLFVDDLTMAGGERAKRLDRRSNVWNLRLNLFGLFGLDCLFVVADDDDVAFSRGKGREVSE